MISDERRKELEEEAKTRTDEDNLLYHVVSMHFGIAAAQLAMGRSELEESEDPRAKQLRDLLDQILEISKTPLEEILDTIPGLLSHEENEQLIEDMNAQSLQIQAIAHSPDDQ